jgi:hypothetical protein
VLAQSHGCTGRLESGRSSKLYNIMNCKPIEQLNRGIQRLKKPSIVYQLLFIDVATHHLFGTTADLCSLSNEIYMSMMFQRAVFPYT